MKIGPLLYSSTLYLTLGILLFLTNESGGTDGGVLKLYCLNDMDCVNKYPSDDATLHSCCDLDYGQDEDLTLYCWRCTYPCNNDKNYCQNLISGASTSWKWVYPSNKDKGTRNSTLSQKLTE